MDRPLCKGLYAVLILFQSFGFSKNVFDKKYFDYNYNHNYPTFFSWLLQFLLLATMKI